MLPFLFEPFSIRGRTYSQLATLQAAYIPLPYPLYLLYVTDTISYQQNVFLVFSYRFKKPTSFENPPFS
jgi:hypothetical protein